MTKRRVPQIMCQARRIDEVGITAQGRPELPADLSALQRMGQPGAREVTRAHLDNLRLGGKPTPRSAVQHPGTVPLERAAPGAARALGRLGCTPGRRLAVVAGRRLAAVTSSLLADVTMRRRGVVA